MIRTLNIISAFAWGFFHRQRSSWRGLLDFARADWANDAWWRIWEISLWSWR